MRFIPQLLLIASLTLAPQLSVGAQVIDNGVPDNTNGYLVNADYQTANDFTLTSATSLGKFNWWALTGDRTPTVTASYTIDVALDASGYPGAVFKSFAVSGATGTYTAYGCCGYAAYLLSADLGGYSLGAGTYWLSISNYVDGTGPYTYWATSATGTGAPQRLAYRGAYRPESYGEGAFNIEAATDAVVATPEPASLALLATGLIGITGLARIRRRP